jgi:hypothetical protein
MISQLAAARMRFEAIAPGGDGARDCSVGDRPMNEPREKPIRRRDVFRAAMAGVAIAAMPSLDTVKAATVSMAEKRKPRYQPQSQEVQDYYRVNRYPQK